MQGENIADNGGIKEAYLAYRKWQQNSQVDPLLPGLDYTQPQMFWIAAAQTRCSAARYGEFKIDIFTKTLLISDLSFFCSLFSFFCLRFISLYFISFHFIFLRFISIFIWIHLICL